MCAIREVILRSLVIYMVANRFRNFVRTCPIAFFSSRDHSPRIRELRSQSRPFIACGNRYSTYRILSLSIDTVSSDSRRIYVPSREMYRLLFAFVRVRTDRLVACLLEIRTWGCSSTRGGGCKDGRRVTRPELMRCESESGSGREKGFMHRQR